MVIKIFQTNLNLLWNMRLAKSIFFFPNQTGIGLENPTHFLGVTFPNQTGFGLEKFALHWQIAVCPALTRFTNSINSCTYDGKNVRTERQVTVTSITLQ